jgi:hypothetical protein
MGDEKIGDRYTSGEHRATDRRTVPPLAPITPQSPPGPPPNVSREDYEASQARYKARQKEIAAAEHAGAAVGGQWGHAIGAFHESAIVLPKLEKAREAAMKQKLGNDLLAHLDRLPLPPAYSDPVLQEAAIRGFEIGAQMGYENARQTVRVQALAALVALGLVDKLGVALERALSRLSRFPIPVYGVGMGGIGGVRVPRLPKELFANENTLRRLSTTIQGKVPLSSQTVVLITTEEGPTIVAAGAKDLTPAQAQLAKTHGFLIADEFPGAHGEITALYSAGKKRFMPTGGVATNKVCSSGTANCLTQISEMARRGGFALELSADGRAFKFVKRN